MIPLLIAACTWANPGANPYQGAPADAVDAYQDIPAPTRALLREKIERRQYDDIAVISRDGIVGRADYANLRDMHFGKSTVCRAPDRSAWADSHQERGLVYCVGEHCLIVPTVCRNVSRVTRRSMATLPPAGGPAGPMSSAGGSAGPFGAIPLLQPIGGDAASPSGTVASDALGLLGTPVLTAAQVLSIPYQGVGFGPSVTSAPPAQYLSAPLPVPEPPAAALLLAGIAAVAWRWRQRRAPSKSACR